MLSIVLRHEPSLSTVHVDIKFNSLVCLPEARTWPSFLKIRRDKYSFGTKPEPATPWSFLASELFILPYSFIELVPPFFSVSGFEIDRGLSNTFHTLNRVDTRTIHTLLNSMLSWLLANILPYARLASIFSTIVKKVFRKPIRKKCGVFDLYSAPHCYGRATDKFSRV